MAKVSKKEPLISVIVPVYKVEEYLDRCIESIVNQTYKNLEIILVDDGSPDNCPKMCDEWAKKDKRVKVIHKENGGLSDARNVGISKSKAQYVSFVDSDDWINNKMISVFYKLLIKYNADFVSGKLIETAGMDGKIDLKKFSNCIRKYNQEEYAKKFFRIDSNEVVHYACGKLFKKEILTNDQFPVGLTAEDVLGTYKALLNSKTIVEIDFPYYCYYKNDDSITRTVFGVRDFDLIKIWDMMIDVTKEKNKKYISWVEFNRNRVDYTILMRMAKDLKFKIIKEKYSKEYKKILIRLKKNKQKLLKSNLPISRKVTIELICLNYAFFVKICCIIRR